MINFFVFLVLTVCNIIGGITGLVSSVLTSKGNNYNDLYLYTFEYSTDLNFLNWQQNSSHCIFFVNIIYLTNGCTTVKGRILFNGGIF